MDSVDEPTTKAFWIQAVLSLEGIKKVNKNQSDSKLIAKFAFGVGITSLTASLISLGIVLLNYGT